MLDRTETPKMKLTNEETKWHLWMLILQINLTDPDLVRVVLVLVLYLRTHALLAKESISSRNQTKSDHKTRALSGAKSGATLQQKPNTVFP